MKWLLPLLLFVGCAGTSTQYSRHPLASQILHPMPGHKGLVNSVCTRDKNNNCVWSYAEYDLTQAAVRQQLRDLKFVCSVNGQLFRPSLDKPLLVRESYSQKCFLFICDAPVVIPLQSIDVTATQALLDAGTYCYSFANYPLEDLVR